MGGKAEVRRELTLSLQQFGRASLERRARQLDIPVSALVRQAVLYYLAVRGSERSALRVPRFARVQQPGTDGVELSLALDHADWSALEVEAVRLRVPLERLIEHAAMLFLADLDSGRVAMRILEEKEEAEEEEGEGGSDPESDPPRLDG